MDTTQAPTDARGYAVFSKGTVGELHVFVHRCVDQGAIELAASTLRVALDSVPATQDSGWVHLHWHQLVLDVELGRWREAHRRFLDRVLPAVSAGQARTDGPSGLWVLALDAPWRRPVLPWGAVADVARSNLDEPDPFLALHDALALAGAGDRLGLDAWIARRSDQKDSAILRVGEGLRAQLRGEQAEATRLLGSARPGLRQLHGSAAQLSIFQRIALGASAALPAAA